MIRAYLRLLGPATPKQVAAYLDAPVKDITARWPSDVVEVSVAGERRWVLTSDADQLSSERVTMTRLLGPFDLFLQATDRTLIVDDPDRAKTLWPVLGRPGAVLLGGEMAGLWRARKSGRTLGSTSSYGQGPGFGPKGDHRAGRAAGGAPARGLVRPGHGWLNGTLQPTTAPAPARME